MSKLTMVPRSCPRRPASAGHGVKWLPKFGCALMGLACPQGAGSISPDSLALYLVVPDGYVFGMHRWTCAGSCADSTTLQAASQPSLVYAACRPALHADMHMATSRPDKYSSRRCMPACSLFCCRCCSSLPASAKAPTTRRARQPCHWSSAAMFRLTSTSNCWGS